MCRVVWINTLSYLGQRFRLCTYIDPVLWGDWQVFSLDYYGDVGLGNYWQVRSCGNCCV